MKYRLLGPLFCLAVVVEAHGAALEKLENIRAAAREFAVQEIGAESDNVHITVGRLDPRLRLAACTTPLSTYFSAGSRTVGHTTVGVRCDGPNPWSLFVPLHIDRQITVAVALNNLPGGHVVGAADVSYELRSESDLNRGYFAPNEPLIGKITTRPLSRGAAFEQGALKKARIVQRGDRVTLALKSGGVAVRVAGTALSDGALGERIPVRNLSSKRIIEGVIHEAGLILVSNPRADL